MNNDRLRVFMIRFAIIFTIVAIGGIYVRNIYVQKNGPRQGFFASGNDDWKIETYDNGKIKSQGAMLEGYKKNGEWTYFREDGTIEAVETYNDGKLVKVVEDGKEVKATQKDTVKK